MDAPLALYRRYRPDTFAEVIGQDHVTGPLRAALVNNRVNHAYLFSGPRGCGKTTSARILARALNCEQGPTPDPCGECRSCRDLARDGAGSIDVIEIDAASHGGVDDARDLRERAFFAPVSSRYKVYIIDEAHMVSTQGFNALLKLVEEPPDHLKFIFATTEPDKVIGTIRSRTHHYPFRLIPPRTLSAYLSELCESEGVPIDQAALPLVVRAGGGSARDTLSVLDQLIGGASEDGVTHDLATGLLGYTPDTLLDEVVDAFAADDGGTVFGVVDKVIETGQDPRRFAEDLLRRLRDLVIIAAVPDAPASGLIDLAEDQAERLVAQAARFGRSDLSRAADLVASGLTEMRGTTAPRLLLELICARVLLPGADDSSQGLTSRLDRLERRLSIEGAPSGPAAPRSQLAGSRPEGPPAGEETPQGPQAPQTPVSAPEPAHDDRAMAASERPAAPAGPHAGTPVPPASAAPPVDSGAPAPPAPDAGSRGLTLVDVRRLWPDVVEATKHRRRVTWIHLSQNAQVLSLEDRTLTLGFTNAGARQSFVSGGSEEILRQVLIDVIGADWRIETIVDPSAEPGGGEARGRTTSPPEPPADRTPATDPGSAPWSAAGETGDADPAPGRPRASPGQREGTEGGPAQTPAPSVDSDAHPDDEDDADQGVTGTRLLEQELGATVLEEIPHDQKESERR